MSEAILNALQALGAGAHHIISPAGVPNLVMIGVALAMFWLAIRKGVEPLLLLPIAFGCLLANLPLSEVMDQGGFLKVLFDMGIGNELFPLLIFVGIGSMTDFTPLLQRPYMMLFGAAGQLGIFLTLIVALALGFPKALAVSVAVIGACDGPTVIYVSNLFAGKGMIDTSMVGALAVAAYSYMALVPIIQPPIMRLLTTAKERATPMPPVKARIPKSALVYFPILVTILTGIIAPKGLPLMGAIMLGNFLKVSGVVERLTKASENEIANVSTLFLGLAIGGTMAGPEFLKPQTLMVFALGLMAIVVDTVGGLLLGKLWYLLSGGKMNPLIGAAGISAYPMAARIVQVEGLRANHQNHLLMHAMGANTGGQIGSVMAASIMLAILKGMGLI
ncbi:MAG: sodium ion-translocating decarboxylase subunit beta [Verrucomicrobiota bacterium]